MSGEIETKQEAGDQVTTWLREIELSSTHEKKWRERAEKVIKRYRDEASDKEETPPKFNILYANTEVLRGVIYQKTPVPDVRRRFLDKDKVGKEAAQILQRALSYSIEMYDFDAVINGVVEDYLLPGRGLAKVRYVPTYAPMTDEMGQPVLDEAGQPQQQVVAENVVTDYVEWDFVRFSPCKRWSKMRWVAFGELLTREELVEQFGEVGKYCSLDWAPKDKENDDELFKRALVWSIWDKPSRKVYCVSKGMPSQCLAVIDDPLNLQNFFPCPEPVYAIKSTGTMIPIPEYTQYQDQAIELDTLTARINVLVEALKRRGAVNASYPELSKIADAGDNQFIPVERFSEMMEKGGIASAIYEAPVDMIAKVLAGLYQQRESVKQIIYEVTGIADVVRGVSNASETLGAQQLKARYANTRTGPRQKAIQVFARDLFRLKAEIIAEKFSPQNLAQMTGVDLCFDDKEKQAIAMQAQAAQAQGQKMPIPEKLNKPTWEQVMQVLKSDQLRGFRVDIETDSTVNPDANEEQKNRVELLGAITSFVQGIGPAIQTGAIPMEVAKEMLSFGVRGFKVSPQMEDALDQIGADKKQAPGQPGQEQAQQAEQQAQQAILMADVRKAQAEASKAEAQAQEALIKVQIAQQSLMQPKMPQEVAY